MTALRNFFRSSLPAYLLSPALVALTTWELYVLQQAIIGSEKQYVRPYSIGYVLVVALIAAIGGPGPGFFTLLLAAAATIYVLIDPAFTWQISRPRDIAEVAALLAVGSLIILAIEATRQARRRADRLLRESEEARARLRTVMDTSPVGIVTCDAQGAMNYANREAERIWGQPLQRISKGGWPVHRLLYPDGARVPVEQMSLTRVLNGESDILHNEYVIEQPGGTRIPVHVSAACVRDENNVVLGGLAIISDIAERKSAEDALRESEARFRSVFESGIMGIVFWTMEGDLTDANDAFLEMVGYTREDMEQKRVRWRDMTPPEWAEADQRAVNELMTTGTCTPLEKEFWRKDGSRVPILLGGATIGESRTSGVAYVLDVTERRRAEEERTRLLTEAQARAEREALINRIGEKQRATDDPDAVQQVAVEALGNALRADRCYFATYDLPRDIAWVGQDWRRSDLPALTGTYRLSDFNIDVAAMYRSGDPVVTEDIRTSSVLSSAAEALTALGLRSGINVPLFDDQGALVAALTVATAEEPRTWTAEEVALVEAVATQTRSTMDLAILLQRERNIAERLQDALTPTVSQGVPGLDLAHYYKSALAEASVGGDFFDVFLIEKGCVALVIGDLSGKGLAAASHIATVRNMLRYALYRGHTVAQAISDLNDTLVEHDLLSGFATLFVGLYDTGAGSLTYVSCGHEPVLLRRGAAAAAAAGTVEELMPTGPVLGAFPEAAYQQAVVPLAPGDALVLYTDGLSEAGRDRHDFLEVSGLATLIREASATETASTLVARIVAGVEHHTHGNPHDDMCLLTAVVNGKT